jgi:hypothetical protein
MIRHRFLLCTFTLALAAMLAFGAGIFGHTAAQSVLQPFDRIGTIGRERPAVPLYLPQADQFVSVELTGVVVRDAATLDVVRTIDTRPALDAVAVSSDETTLAVAVDLRIDVYDLPTGTLVARFEPPGARAVQGPLRFTRGDELLVFDTLVPAPQELRRSENDTVLLPWVWDVAAAREERRSVLVNGVDSYPFFEPRVSLITGPGGVVVLGLNNRLHIFDTDTPDLEQLADITIDRLETDPVTAWQSATEPILYVATDRFGGLLQIDTRTNTLRALSLGRDLGRRDFAALRDLPRTRAYAPLAGAPGSALETALFGSPLAANTALTVLDVLVPLAYDPLTAPPYNTAVLTFRTLEQQGRGVVELIRPPDYRALAFEPTTRALAMRGGPAGAIDVFDLETGSLRRTFTPHEPSDPTAVFAFSADGETLVSDWERYAVNDPNPETAVTRLRPAYTQPFSSFAFLDDTRMITFGGSQLPAMQDPRDIPWRIWAIDDEARIGSAVGARLLREGAYRQVGDTVLQTSADNTRLLTGTLNTPPYQLHIIDVLDDRVTTYPFPAYNPGALREQPIFNPSWTRYALVGVPRTSPEGSSISPVAVYALDGTLLYTDDGAGVPGTVSFNLQVAWEDDTTLVLIGENEPVSRVLTGITYHPSGLPLCAVEALPDAWERLIPAWERLVLNQQQRPIDAAAARWCETIAASTAEDAPSVDALLGLLTATPRADFAGGRTPAAIRVPGVPACITRTFQGDVIAYSDLWQRLTEGITDPAELRVIETMICEGLITDLAFLQPTPTADPNSLIVATATPAEAVAQTTGGDEGVYVEMRLDVLTGVRTLARRTGDRPGSAATLRDVLIARYTGQFQSVPILFAYSPGGRYAAALDRERFPTLFRLTRTFDQFLAEAGVGGAAAPGVRSIGLRPTATPTPRVLDTPLPSPTPTMTLTPFPLPQSTPSGFAQWGEFELICPSQTVATLDEPPTDYAPPGRIVVGMPFTVDDPTIRYTIDPRTGVLTATDDLPLCGSAEDCGASPDGEWLLRLRFFPDGTTGDAIVSRSDGRDARVVMTADDVRYLNVNFEWVEAHTLLIRAAAYTPGVVGINTLVSEYDPETGQTTPRALPTPVPTLGLLPFDTIQTSPDGAWEVLQENFSGGQRFYLRRIGTDEARVFAQSGPDGTIGRFTWRGDSRVLFFYDAGDTAYALDVETAGVSRFNTIGVVGEDYLLEGSVSPDGRLRAYAYTNPMLYERAVLLGLPRSPVQVWDQYTGLMRYYCIPDLGYNTDQLFTGPPRWSPDSRYLAFPARFPVGGDRTATPTPAVSPEAPAPTGTPIPQAAFDEAARVRVVVLDTETGSVTVLGDIASIIDWVEDEN